MRLRFLTLSILAVTVLTTSCKKAEEETDEIIANFLVGQFEQDACSMVDSLSSSYAMPATTIVFENNSNKDLKIDWIDFAGNLITYKEKLEPGESHTQGTYLTHPWYITTDDGNTCITILTGLRPNETDTVSFTNL